MNFCVVFMLLEPTKTNMFRAINHGFYECLQHLLELFFTIYLSCCICPVALLPSQSFKWTDTDTDRASRGFDEAIVSKNLLIAWLKWHRKCNNNIMSEHKDSMPRSPYENTRVSENCSLINTKHSKTCCERGRDLPSCWTSPHESDPSIAPC